LDSIQDIYYHPPGRPGVQWWLVGVNNYWNSFVKLLAFVNCC